RDEFQQRAIGIAEIDASASPLGAEALNGAGVDRNPATSKVCDGVADGTAPLKAEVAVSRLHRQPRHLGRRKSRPVEIELNGAEPVGPSARAPYELGAENIPVERVRTFPVGNVDDAMIETDRQCHGVARD